MRNTARFTVTNQTLRGSLLATRMFHALQCVSNTLFVATFLFANSKAYVIKLCVASCGFLVGY